MQLDDHRAQEKLKALMNYVETAASKGIKDAGSFMIEKLVRVVINSEGHDATQSKRPQPPHNVSGGQFVRARTGHLKQSMKLKVEGGRAVISSNPSIAPYGKKVSDWSKRKYGRSFMTITVNQYGGIVRKVFAKEIARAVKAADNLTPYTYENDYPIA